MDSPGGDALASDLMWREIQILSKDKPVIASMSDTAASGRHTVLLSVWHVSGSGVLNVA